MTHDQLYRDVVRAIAVGEGDRAASVIDEIPEESFEGFNTYVAAMFSGLVAHYFDDDAGPEAIKQFVDELRHDYRNAEPPLKPLVMEGLLRAFFGEDHLLDDITPEDQLQSEFLVIRKIYFQSEHVQQQLDNYLSDAALLAREWSSED